MDMSYTKKNSLPLPQIRYIKTMNNVLSVKALKEWDILDL